jgi:hypothetical protein
MENRNCKINCIKALLLLFTLLLTITPVSGSSRYSFHHFTVNWILINPEHSFEDESYQNSSISIYFELSPYSNRNRSFYRLPDGGNEVLITIGTNYTQETTYSSSTVSEGGGMFKSGAWFSILEHVDNSSKIIAQTQINTTGRQTEYNNNGTTRYQYNNIYTLNRTIFKITVNEEYGVTGAIDLLSILLGISLVSLVTFIKRKRK